MTSKNYMPLYSKALHSQTVKGVTYWTAYLNKEVALSVVATKNMFDERGAQLIIIPLTECGEPSFYTSYVNFNISECMLLNNPPTIINDIVKHTRKHM